MIQCEYMFPTKPRTQEVNDTMFLLCSDVSLQIKFTSDTR